MTHSQGTGGHGSCDIQQNTGVFGAAYSGEQLMYLNDYGAAGTGIAQNLTLTFGTTYQLTFQVSGVKDRANAGGLQVQFGSFSAIVAASASAGAWHGYDYQYTPLASGAAQLKFTSTSNAPVNIDAVSLVPLPPVLESLRVFRSCPLITPKDAQSSLQMLAISRYGCALRLDRTPFVRAARSRPKNSQALSLQPGP